LRIAGAGENFGVYRTPIIMPTRRRSRLEALLAQLTGAAGRVSRPPVRDPYRLLLWEQVAYLTDDATRLAAFRQLDSEIGTDPAAILRAPLSALRQVTRTGGATGADLRAKRIRFIAERALDRWDGDLWPAARLPYEDAVRELMRYPTIGRPTAERILLLAGTHRPLALDSNGVRVLLRLGYGQDRGRYDKTYASVQSAAADEVASTHAARISAHFVLRAHGEKICVRERALCGRCPVQKECPSDREH
jgi:endonuclease-3